MSTADHSSKPTNKHRRLLLGGSFLGFLLLCGWLIYFLVTFDLNDFRSELETQLSEQLSLPVQIGSIDYRVHDVSLSLHVTELQAGTAGTSVEIKVPQLWFDLLWHSLLKGKIRFSKITLDSALIRADLGRIASPEHNGQQATSAQQPLIPFLLQTVKVNSLEINNATADLSWPGDTLSSRLYLSDISGTLTDLGLVQNSAIAFRGGMKFTGQRSPSPFKLQAALDLTTLDRETLPDFHLDLQVTALDVTALQASLPTSNFSATGYGTADLKFYAKGSPGQAKDFQLSMQSQDLIVSFGKVRKSSGRIGHLAIKGRWQKQGQRHQIDDLSVTLDDSLLAGAVTWDSTPPASGLFTLSNGMLSTNSVLGWLPQLPEAGQAIVNHLERRHGKAWFEQGRIRYSEEPDLLSGHWRLESLQGKLGDLVWTPPEKPVVKLEKLQFAYDAPRLKLTDGTVTIDTTPVNLHGSLDFTTREPDLAFELDTTIAAGELVARTAFAAADFVVDGSVPIHGSLQGSMQDLRLDIQADLQDLSMTYGSDLYLKPGAQDHLTLNCALEGSTLNIEHAGMQWSILEGHLNGQIPMAEPDAMQLEGFFTIPDLARLSETLPILNKVALHGQADLAMTQQGLPTTHRPKLELTLRDAGVATGDIIADLTRINGRLYITETGFSTDRLRINLGESPLLVAAQLDDFSSPALELQVEARSIRADELIFPSDMNYLHNVKGRVIIDREGIRLDPVSLDLDQGTNPVIRGMIMTKTPVSAELDITADFANIGEIIALWAEQSPSARKANMARRAKQQKGKPPQVTIRAHAKTGSLYGMRFHDAFGTIIPSPGHLSIHPLAFHVGEGFCNAQVLVDTQAGGKPSLLRISGHAEDVDALEVYRELLKQKNIVRGRLRGDFYLQGQVGSTYLPTSFGRFNIEIRNGVLHKFQVLSKVFSLLNVSQLFAFQLPDMDRDGMPFNRLTANFLLDQGLLQSDDLVIRSDAMNQAYQGEFNLIDKQLDMVMAVNPLGTVDKVVSRLPVAGWLLTGKDKALLTAHFKIKGPVDNVRVTPVPITTLSDETIGLLRRTFSLPFKLVEDPKILWGGQENSE